MQTIKMWLRNIRSRLRRQVFFGKSRDEGYLELGLFHVSVRWWRNRKPKLDIIIWWPKVRVIKGKV